MPIRFPWTPDFGAQAPHQPRVRSVQFGDGYRQDQEDGLNIDLPAWEVQFSNRSKAEADGIEAFLRARRGVDRFWFKLPDSDFSVTGHGFGVGDNATVTFQLQRTRVNLTQDVLGTWPVYTTPRTNYATYSQALASWVAANSPTIRSAAKTYGSLALDLVGDTSASTLATFYQAPALPPGDAPFSFFIAQGSSTTTAVRLLDVTTGTDRGCAIVTWAGGVPTVTMARPSGTGSSGTLDGVDSVGGGIYRVRCTAQGVISGNINRLYAYPCMDANTNVSLTGDVYLGGFQAGAAGSYIPTTTAAVTVTPAYYPATTDGFEAVTDPGPDLAIYRQDWQGNQQMYPWARTNLCPRSVPALAAAGYEFSGTAGTNSTGPDGTTSAMTFATGASTSDIFAPITAAAQAAGAFTASCWVLPTEADSVEFLRVDNASSAQVGAGNTVPTLTPGVWQVVSVTTTNPSSQTLRPHIRIKTGRTCRVAEFQLEVGSAATSRIPTAGTAASRTDYTLGTAGAVTFAVAPLTNAILTWSGSGADWRLVTCKRWTPAIGQTWKISATFQQEVA